MTVLHILVAMPCAKICSDIDGTIKSTQMADLILLDYFVRIFKYFLLLFYFFKII